MKSRLWYPQLDVASAARRFLRILDGWQGDALSIERLFVLDYFGTGDSSGEFEQATAANWIDDIVNACIWLKSQGINKVIVWGVRFGALLALHAQKKIQEVLSIVQFIFWKPVTNGKQFAGQFLRVKQANTMMNSGEKTNWRQFILDGNDTEVAGYTLNASMLISLESLHFLPEEMSRQFLANVLTYIQVYHFEVLLDNQNNADSLLQ